MSKSDAPKIVTALFSFKGKNNDEFSRNVKSLQMPLSVTPPVNVNAAMPSQQVSAIFTEARPSSKLCFRKGDVITVTQTVDGGWWEGTLNDKTAWFPSNYVKEYQPTDNARSSVKSSPEKSQESPVKDQRINRDIVLKDLVDSEKANVAELQGLATNFLQPLESANILSKKEYKQLIGNIYDVLEAHQRLLSSVEATVSQGPDARVGNLFLMLAPRLKAVHTAYCAGHPQAVCILDRYRDELNEFMEHSGAVTPGILVMTTGLSKPFRRLDKYSAMLQELERHTEKNHPDRGDTQRSVSVYREISERCAATRKQRELALHVLTSGIKGWEGEELNTLGDILHVGPVTLAVGTERRDRYFVLFPMTLLVLSTSPRMSSFVYEGKLPLTGIDVMAVADTEDVRNAFEISGPMIESIAVSCPSRDERQQWIELLSQEDNSVARTAEIPCHVSLLETYRGPVYGRLSRYYARLVRKKIISPELVKRLLYLQYVYKPDLSAVRMRKRNEITTYAICPRRRSSNDTTSDETDEMILAIPEVREKRSIMKSTIMLDVRYAWDGDEAHSSLPGEGNCEDEVLPACRSLPGHATGSKRDESDDFEHWSEALESWRSCRTVTNLVAIDEDQPIKQTGSCDLLPFPATSQHSLDSGMAESCRMNSADLNSACYRYRHRLGDDRQNGGFLTSDTESDNYEHQCICSSPFGSTPRTSPINLLDTDFSAFSACGTSGLPEVTENKTERRLLDLGTPDKRNTVPLMAESKNNPTRPGRYAKGEMKENDADSPTKQEKIYTSGLYAHWWLKKDIPGISTITEQGKLPMAWLTSNQSNGKSQSSGAEHCSSPGIKTPWSLASLRPAPPLYSLKIYGKSDNAESARTPRTLNERQFEDDAIILKVIEGYCLTVNARFTVHSALLDNETTYITRDDSLSVMNSRVDRWDSGDDRSLSETVETLKVNIADLQTKMSQISSQLDEERRSRQLLAALVKRNFVSQDAALVP